MKKNLIISGATRNNWNRLNVEESEIENKLSKMANKLYSKKNIIPVEYFQNKDNFVILEDLSGYIKNNSLTIPAVIYNLSLNQLIKFGLAEIVNGKIYSENKYLLDILNELKNEPIIEYLIKTHLPEDEYDILGIVYQSMLIEGNKNKFGSYYTPRKIAQKFVKEIHPDTVYLDPCCGTGGFLLTFADAVKIKTPENLYGFDKDYIACFISKINLILHFKNKIFLPKIYNRDFLLPNDELGGMKFDIISTNPPWGAVTAENYSSEFPEIKSGEIFSYFIIKSERLLKQNGHCSFILPVSVLNVKTHADIRKFILDKFRIERIEHLGKAFSGVFSDVISMDLSKRISVEPIKIICKDKEQYVSQNIYKKNYKYNFSVQDNKDAELLDKIYSIPYTTLSESLWGMGIVTGNNAKHIVYHTGKSTEKIYTGKEIQPYFINETEKHITYDRKLFQQTAPDYIYRANEKLVYKFISKTPVFAYDSQKRLFLNSANILIPQVKSHTIKTVLGFLNSTLFKYIYIKKFNEIKMLKGNLLQFPFPVLTGYEKNVLDKKVQNYLDNRKDRYLKEIDKIVFTSFQLNPDEIGYINKSV